MGIYKYNMEENNKLLWWGYKHINGSYQVKRFFDREDIAEAMESPFCSIISGVFYADSREEAMEILIEKLK